MKLSRRSPWRGWIAPLVFIPSAAAAQPTLEPICADRPGKATGTCTVATGHVQLEVGLADWSLTKGSGSRETSVTFGETVIKVGLTERSEFAVDFTPYARSVLRADGVREPASGLGDTLLLYKRRITADDAPVEVALLPTVKIPTAKRDIGNGKVEAALLVPVSYDFPDSKLSIGATPEVDWVADADGHGHHAAMAQVISLTLAAAERLSVSAELWSQYDWDHSGTGKQASVDGSIAYAVSNDVQLDAGANFGLNRETPDVELYAGASVRF